MSEAAKNNVAVVLTPTGAAAIAVIRLSGPRVDDFLRARFSKSTPIGRCMHGLLRDESGETIDDPVVVRVNETIADVNVHGGAWVVSSVLNLAARAGFEVCDAATVPAVAYDAASEIWREVMEHVPRARTELALRVLLSQPAAWARVRGTLTREALRAIVADRSLVHLLDPPCVAIIGSPNVGKSTLANQLFAQERSITADVPGTTRDWVSEIANIDGLAVMLLDTPGVRETGDPIEREAIERSRAEVNRTDLVVVVFDASRRVTPEELGLLSTHRDAIAVVNKADRDCGEAAQGIQTIATTGSGVDELRRAIRHRFGCLDEGVNRPRVWTERQLAIVERAIMDSTALEEL